MQCKLRLSQGKFSRFIGEINFIMSSNNVKGKRTCWKFQVITILSIELIKVKLVCKGVSHSGRDTHESSWCAIVSLLTSMLGHVLLCYTITYFTFSLTLQQLHIFTIYRKYFLTVCIYFCHIAQSQNNCSQYSQTTLFLFPVCQVCVFRLNICTEKFFELWTAITLPIYLIYFLAYVNRNECNLARKSV